MPTDPVRVEASKTNFTVKELAFVLGRNPKTIRRLIGIGKINTLPVGKPYLIPVREYARLTGAA